MAYEIDMPYKPIGEGRNGGVPIRVSIPRRVVDTFSKRGKRNTEIVDLLKPEIDLLTEWVKGLPQKRLAANRFVSGHTAGNPITQIYEKRPVPRVSEAVVRVIPKHMVQQAATEQVDKQCI